MRNIRRFFQVEHKDCYTEGQEEIKEESNKRFKRIMQIEGIPLLFAVYFLTFFAFSLFYAGLPVYANQDLGWSAVDLGLFLAYSSLIMIVVQGPVLTRLSSKVSGKSLILFGSLMLAVSFYLLQWENIYLLYAANTFLSLGNGLMWPSFLSQLAATGEKRLQGEIQGYGTSMGSIASMIGLMAGGVLFESIGTQVFLFGSLIFVLISLIMFPGLKRQKNVQKSVT